MAISIDDSAVVWSHGGRLENRPLVVLLHGYGQHESAMAVVARALDGVAATAALRGPRASRPPVFWGRTENDFAIAPELVALTEQWLSHTVRLTHRVYPGDTHAILADELADAVEFLSSSLGRG